jgi:hypothetical protein
VSREGKLTLAAVVMLAVTAAVIVPLSLSLRKARRVPVAGGLPDLHLQRAIFHQPRPKAEVWRIVRELEPKHPGVGLLLKHPFDDEPVPNNELRSLDPGKYPLPGAELLQSRGRGLTGLGPCEAVTVLDVTLPNPEGNSRAEVDAVS